MKVCLAYPFSEPHGMDRINAVVIDTLLREGIDVSVATLCKKDLGEYFRRKFGIDVPEGLKVYSLFPRLLSGKPIVAPFWEWFSLKRVISMENPDVVYLDGLMYRCLNVRDRDLRVIVYVHEPLSIKWEKGLSVAMTLRRMYGHLYKVSLDFVQDRNSPYTVVCNSRWSAKLFESAYGRRARVIYPPVSTRKFSPGRKENLVTSIGVFNPRKRYETIIRATAAARTQPKLRIIGSLSPGEFWYLKYLKKLIEKLKAADRIHIHLDLPFTELVSVVSRSKICVSAGIEFFGIAVVEQMSAGCVPIVHRSFAPFSDIVDYGKFGFGFSTATELQETIDKLIENSSLCNEASLAAIERAKGFDEEIFRRNITNLVRGNI